MTRKPRNEHQQNTRYDTRHTARLLSDIAALRRELRAARLLAANLEAAIRAALGAARDGEADPLLFLRDEIPGHGGDRHDA